MQQTVPYGIERMTMDNKRMHSQVFCNRYKNEEEVIWVTVRT